MKTKCAVYLFATLLLATVLPVKAQQPAKNYRIGILTGASHSSEIARTEALRHGLRELGYVEGENISVEYRYAEGKLDRLPSLAAELVRLKVDVMSRRVRYRPGAPRKRRARSPLSWRRIPIPLAMRLSPALRGRVET